MNSMVASQLRHWVSNMLRRAVGLLGHLIAIIGLVWLLSIAILLIGLPVVAVVRLIAAAIKFGFG